MCKILTKGCQTDYSGDDISMSQNSLKLLKQKNEGHEFEVCIECQNSHQTIHRDNLKIIQMPSPCLETITTKDLKQIDIKDGDKVGFAKTDFFKNSKETECPINKCELKEVGCKTEYSASILKISQSADFEITVDYNKITKV